MDALDYVLVSLFYMKSEFDAGEAWERVDGRTAWLSTK